MPRNFGVVEEGKIYRGAQPSAEDLQALRRIGIRTILKLNTNELNAERAEATLLGMRVIDVPLSARSAGTSKSCADVERAYAVMVDPANWPVYVHCEHGRDRTGFLIGLYRERAEGWDFDQVSRELTQYGHDGPMRLVFPSISRALADRNAACSSSQPLDRGDEIVLLKWLPHDGEDIVRDRLQNRLR